MYTYISQNKPNRMRQPELDLSKFIAIILMIACHCGTYFFKEGTVAYAIFDLIGSEFAAPVFMVCMGVGVVFSKHNQPKLLINRGVKIFLFGYLLNLIRCTIPEFIIYFVDESKLQFGPVMPFFIVDILQFAGLALIIMGFFKKLKVEPVYQLMIAILFAGLGDVLAGISTGYLWLDFICDLFWGANQASLFPVLNWLVYPAAGVVFGEVLMHCSDKTALYKRLLPIGLFGVSLSYYLIFTDPNYYSHNIYYFMGIKNVIYGLCYPILLFSICYFVTYKNKLGDNRFIIYSSKNLNTLYCISWVVILWIWYFVIILNDLKVTYISFIILSIIVLAVSYGLCQIWLKIKKKIK